LYTTSFVTRLAAETYFKSAAVSKKSTYGQVSDAEDDPCAKPAVILEFESTELAETAEKMFYPTAEFDD